MTLEPLTTEKSHVAERMSGNRRDKHNIKIKLEDKGISRYYRGNTAVKALCTSMALLLTKTAKS